MLKARSTNGNRTLITLGLEAENIKRLKEGKPIHLHCDDLGFVGELLIFYGETQEDCVKIIAPYITEDTIVHDENKKAKQ